jgi:hypothetical protein
MNYLRREAGKKKAKRVLRILRPSTTFNPDFYADDGDWAKKMLKTRVTCSRPCCGNPRKWFGQVTLQEKRAQLEETE